PPRAILHDDNAAALKPWRAKVAATARAAYGPTPPVEDPVLLIAQFRLPRPKTSKRVWPAVRPDLDKLTRALLDGITEAGVWRDDSQVVVARVEKVYDA